MSEKLTNFADLVTSVVKFEVWDYKFDGGVYSGASDRAIVDLADVTLGVANALKDSDWLQKLGGGSVSCIFRVLLAGHCQEGKIWCSEPFGSWRIYSRGSIFRFECIHTGYECGLEGAIAIRASS